MAGTKVHTYVRPGLKAENNLTKFKARERPASASTLSIDNYDQSDRWFIGFDCKESINVPKNAIPKPLLDVLKKPMLPTEHSNNAKYDRSKFQFTGLHGGDESRVEISLLAEGGGRGFADVMPGSGGFVITVPELFEFEGKSFTADEFLQAINAAKAQFQIRSTPIETNASGSGTKKP